MRKIHGRKAVTLTLAGAAAGGLLLYGAVRLGRRLVAAPAVQRVAHFIRVLVEHSIGTSAGGAGGAGEAGGNGSPRSETVFQADAASAHDPGWTPPQAPNVYGPN